MMNTTMKFDFSDDTVAETYEQVLVPLLFEPWTAQLIEENGPWSSRYVLDLACGTGVVTRQLLNKVTCKGKVFALDLNEEMLAINKAKFEELGCDDAVEFIRASAEAIPLEDGTMDIVICQQGFQFFSDKNTSAQEMYRVLSRGGSLIVSTWLPVSECEIMGTLCETLEAINEKELSRTMRIPFDHMPKNALKRVFTKAGFQTVEIEKQMLDLHLEGGLEEAIAFVYGTPIGPSLSALPVEKQEQFKQFFKRKVKHKNETNFGKMTAHILRAYKQ